MKRIILINSCVRGNESRTLKLTRGIIDRLKEKAVFEEINLSNLGLIPYTESNNPNYHGVESRFVELAKKIADSDGLLIAAPFWDMSFPSLLKVFLEKLSLNEIMFKDNGKTCVGIAKCPFMFYVTTRGMNIPDNSSLEQASPYLKALCELWGIKHFDFVSVFNCDYISLDELNKKIQVAIDVGSEKLLTLFEEIK